MKTKFTSALERAKNFWKNADAQDLVEYALLLMMVALIAVASVKSLSATIKNAFSNANAVMTEAALPGNATGTVAASLAGTAAVDNAAANVNGAAAAAEGTVAAAAAAEAAADFAAAQAALGPVTSTTFGWAFTRTTTGPASLAQVAAAAATPNAATNITSNYDAYTAAAAAAAGDGVVAADDALASADDAAAGIAAALGVNTGPIGSTALAAAGNTADADATGKSAAGTILFF